MKRLIFSVLIFGSTAIANESAYEVEAISFPAGVDTQVGHGRALALSVR